jgi:hypothetical protein
MKVIVQDTYGSSDVPELRDIDKPEIGDDSKRRRIEGGARSYQRPLPAPPAKI